LTIGDYNLKYAQENNDGKNVTVSWNPLVNNKYWTVNIYGAKVGDKDIKMSVKTAIVDTGTSYLLMPTGRNSKY